MLDLITPTSHINTISQPLEHTHDAFLLCIIVVIEKLRLKLIQTIKLDLNHYKNFLLSHYVLMSNIAVITVANFFVVIIKLLQYHHNCSSVLGVDLNFIENYLYEELTPFLDT